MFISCLFYVLVRVRVLSLKNICIYIPPLLSFKHFILPQRVTRTLYVRNTAPPHTLFKPGHRTLLPMALVLKMTADECPSPTEWSRLVDFAITVTCANTASASPGTGVRRASCCLHGSLWRSRGGRFAIPDFACELRLLSSFGYRYPVEWIGMLHLQEQEVIHCENEMRLQTVMIYADRKKNMADFFFPFY